MNLNELNNYLEEVDNKIDNQIININTKLKEVKQQILYIEELIKTMKRKQDKNNLF